MLCDSDTSIFGHVTQKNDRRGVDKAFTKFVWLTKN